MFAQYTVINEKLFLTSNIYILTIFKQVFVSLFKSKTIVFK